MENREQLREHDVWTVVRTDGIQKRKVAVKRSRALIAFRINESCFSINGVFI